MGFWTWDLDLDLDLFCLNLGPFGDPKPHGLNSLLCGGFALHDILQSGNSLLSALPNNLFWLYQVKAVKSSALAFISLSTMASLVPVCVIDQNRTLT